MRQLLLLPLLLIFGTTDSSAQRDVPSDRVAFLDGTVRKGQVRGTGLRDPGKPIQFREEGTLSFQPLAVGEVELIRLGSGREIRSVSVELPDLTRGGIEITRRRFGEVLADGYFELIRVPLRAAEYIDQAEGMQPYLYLIRQDEVELVLELSVIEVYEMLHANPSRFRHKLRYLVRDCPDAAERARRADFTDASILRVLQTYAECDPSIAVKIDRNRLRGGVRFDHYVQTGYIGMLDADFSAEQFSMHLGYRAEANILERFRRISVAGEADLVYHTFLFRDRGRASQTMARGRFSLGYAAVHRPDFSLQLAGGLSTYGAVSSSFRSFFANNYALLYGGLQLKYRDARAVLAYEHFPNPRAERPANMLLLTFGYRLPL